MIPRYRGLTTVIVALGMFAFAVFLGGCGSSDSSSSTSTGSTRSSEEASETSEESSSTDVSESEGLPASTAKPPTGKPVVFADITDVTGIPAAPFNLFPESEKVAVEYVNEYLGGIQGRPLELWTCNSQYEAAATSACVNEALQHEPVLQMGLSVLLAANGSQALHAQDIPTLNVPDVPADAEDKDSFPLGGGGFAEYPAIGYYVAAKKGAKSASLIVPALPEGEFFAEQVKGSAEEAGLTDIEEASYNQNGTDLTPTVAKAVGSQPDALVEVVNTSQATQMFKVLEQQGYPSDQVIGQGAASTAKDLEAAGSSAEGVEFTSEFDNFDDLGNPDIRTYRAAMEKYDPSLDARAEFSVWGFSNVVTMAEVLNGLKGEPTGKNLLEFLRGAKRVPIFAGNELNADAAPPALPAIRNPAVTVIRWNAEKKLMENAVDGYFTAPVNKP